MILKKERERITLIRRAGVECKRSGGETEGKRFSGRKRDYRRERGPGEWVPWGRDSGGWGREQRNRGSTAQLEVCDLFPEAHGQDEKPTIRVTGVTVMGNEERKH